MDFHSITLSYTVKNFLTKLKIVGKIEGNLLQSFFVLTFNPSTALDSIKVF